jgi:phenylpyruvate tautomerase PptA (4-oxalocrotonate tautomerase family)
MHSDQLARLADAMTQAAAAIAEKPATLVSVTFDQIATQQPSETATPVVEVTRATRTLVFSRGDLRGEDGRLLLSATAVHRI